MVTSIFRVSKQRFCVLFVHLWDVLYLVSALAEILKRDDGWLPETIMRFGSIILRKLEGTVFRGPEADSIGSHFAGIYSPARPGSKFQPALEPDLSILEAREVERVVWLQLWREQCGGQVLIADWAQEAVDREGAYGGAAAVGRGGVGTAMDHG